MKKSLFGIAAVAAIVGMVVIGANLEAAGPRVTKDAKMRVSDDYKPATHVVNQAATVTPISYFTDFEVAEGYTARDGTCVQNPCAGAGGPGDGCNGFTGQCGFIDGQGVGYPAPWGVSTSNPDCMEAHIDTDHPFSGTQHLRFQQDICDPTNAFSFAIDARIPPSPPKPQPITPATIKFWYSVPTGLFGSDMNFQPQANSQGFWTTRLMVFYYGFFYVLEDRGAGLGFYPIFFYWDSMTPAYHQVDIVHDPCEKFKCLGGPNNQQLCPNGTSDCRVCSTDGSPCVGDFQCPGGTCDGGDCIGSVTWMYDKELIYKGTMMNGTTTEQMLFYTDNFPGFHDIDHMDWQNGEPCPTICGNLEIEVGEQCDGANDANCPGRCIDPGATGPGGEPECTCIIDGETCEEASPLPNGLTTVLTHGGWWTWTADVPAYAIDYCETYDYDSAFYAWTGTCNTLEFMAINDDCDVNSPYSYGYADPLAPCHPVSSPWQACTCIETNIGQQYWVQTFRMGIGDTTGISLTKRETCDVVWEGGACCDGKGVCTDDVLAADCMNKGDVWHAQKYCSTVQCETTLGACCDHGPGLGGLCIDHLWPDDCVGDKQDFYLGLWCIDVQCDEVRGACCDGTHGTCSQTLASNCVGTNKVWTQATPCSQVPCDPLPGACVDQFNPDPLARDCLCTDNVILADCQGDKVYWVKGSSCAAQLPLCEANFQAIPTVSEWGLVVLALLLLVGAKVYFGRREAVA